MSSRRLPPEVRLDFYRTAVSRAVPRLLGMLDRNRDSASAGSFDRDHWAWKFRDFPIGMLQMGMVPLARLHGRPLRDPPGLGSERVLEWIVLGTRETLRRQHRNGAFDSVGPFTQDHGMSLLVAFVLASVGSLLEDRLPTEILDRMRDSVRLACAFGERSRETHAFISNHQALFALAFLRAARFVGDTAFEARSDALLDGVLERQSADGWYHEYGGPDPGYETLGLYYLCELQAERPSERLARSLDRSVEFLSHAVHPDGGIGGVYGSRHTSLWVPGGIEKLALRLPLAEAIAGHVAHHLPESPVVTLDSVDQHNLPPLLGGYLSAVETLEARLDRTVEPALLPCHSESVRRHFDDAGITVVSTPRYFAVLAGRKGGAGVVHARETGKPVFRDAGYLARTRGRVWTSQLLGSSEPASVATGDAEAIAVLRVEGQFSAVKEQMVTPWNFLGLRILNLTLFRSVRLGGILRDMIISRIITGRRSGQLRLDREIRFEPDRIVYRDRIRNDSGASVTDVRLSHSFMGIHMGSARYFAGADLDPGFEDEGSLGESDLAPGTSLDRSFMLMFGGPSSPKLMVEEA